MIIIMMKKHENIKFPPQLTALQALLLHPLSIISQQPPQIRSAKQQLSWRYQ